MSRKEAYIRLRHIVNKLRRKKSSFKEISDYLDSQSELEGYDFKISDRTFKRDRDEISVIWSIDIQWDNKQKVYYIENDGDTFQKDKLYEAFDTIHLLNMSEDLSNIIHFEKRKPKGTENLFLLIHAIKNRLKIKFEYEKFWDDTISKRIVEPYSLKEFKNRWYLIGKTSTDKHVKTFALDRMRDMELTKEHFEVIPGFDMKEMFRYCYGIITPKEEQPEVIILSFDNEQGKYIKSLPLHESQEILVDNEDELQIKLKLNITHDLEMELLSFGDNVKILQPLTLARRIKDSHEKAWKQYREY